jgi:hypothetical protein
MIYHASFTIQSSFNICHVIFQSRTWQAAGQGDRARAERRQAGLFARLVHQRTHQLHQITQELKELAEKELAFQRKVQPRIAHIPSFLNLMVLFMDA